jgi:two-component system KDP operon response regulator KdpE
MTSRANGQASQALNLDPNSAQADELFRQAALASRSILDAVAHQVAIVDSSGAIIGVNEAWRHLADAGGDDLVAGNQDGQNYIEALRGRAESGSASATQAVEGFRSVLRRGSGHFSLEYESAADGGARWYHFAVSALTHLPGALITHRDVTERRRDDEALSNRAGALSFGPLFESFVPALVRNLARALNVAHTFFGERLDTERARILTHWTGEGFGEAYDYEIAGKPAEMVLEGRTVAFPSSLRSVFPDDPKEWRRSAQSYIAVPIFGAHGEALGLLGAIDFKPLENVALAEAILTAFAAQLGPELNRRRTERLLAERAQLIEYAPDAIIATDKDLVITYWNKTAEDIYGWTADEVLGRTTKDVLKTAVSEERLAAAQRVMLEAGEFRGVSVQRRRDGSAFDVELIGRPSLGDNGSVRGFVLATRDISERKHAEHALQQAEARVRGILEAIPDMMFTLDAQGTFLSFKPAKDLAPLVPPEEFVGKHVAEILPPDIAPSIIRAIDACVRSAEPQTFEYDLPMEGEIRSYECRLVLISPGEVLSVVRDVTAHRRQEANGRNPTAALKRSRAGGKPRILIVDGDVHLLRFMRRTLEQAGSETVVASDTDAAIRMAELEEPDLILLDLELAGAEGLDLVLDISRLSGAALIVLSPQGHEPAAVRALKLGADDFIVKPFSIEELHARVEAALRRTPHPQPQNRQEFGDLVIDPWNRLVTVGGRRVALTATEYRLVVELANAGGRLLTHDEILDRVWGASYAGQYDLVRSFVRSLRRKLGDDARRPRFVLAERGMGYRMAQTVGADITR